MSEQEQIEEIVECMFNCARQFFKPTTALEENIFINSCKEALRNYAEAFYNADYRKVPDDAVVLTKEEYERLKSDRKIRVVTKHEEDDYEICIPASEYDEMFEQVRKETAKEILQTLREKGTFTYDYPDEPHSPIIIYSDYILEEIAEKCGVEVEE